MSRISVKIAADTSELVRLQTEAKRFSARFKQAFEFSVGAAAFGGLAIGVSRLKEGFEQAIRSGVNFNAQMEDARIGVAAVLRQFNPGQFSSFSQAMIASGDAIDLLKEKAKKSPATFQELVGAFQGLSGAASAAGMNTKRQVDLVVLMSQTLAGLGIRSEQILQESRALLTGNITEDAAAARILGITKSQIDNANREGKLYEFLVAKMSGFSEAAEVGSRSYTTALSNMEDSTQQLFAELSEPIFETLKESILEVNETLGSVEFKNAIRPFFQDAAAVVQIFASLAKWTVENAGAISFLARALGTLGAAYGAIKLSDWIVTMGKEIAARQNNAATIAQETAVLRANTIEKERNAAATARAAAAALGSGLAPAAGALAAAPMAALPGSTSIVPVAGGALGPSVARGGAGRGFIDIESQVLSTTYKAQATMQAASQTAAKVAATTEKMLSGVGVFVSKVGASMKQAAGSPILSALAGVAGWEIGKMLRRPIYGFNGEEDLAKNDDYQKQWNVRAKAFHEQQSAVTSVIEKEKYLSDLIEARAEIEDQLAKETAPLLRGELSQQLKMIEAMVYGAERINETMMRRNQARITADAAKSKTDRERTANAANYDEGLKQYAATTTAGQIAALEKEIAKNGKSIDESELKARYAELQKTVAERQKVTADENPVALAQAEVRKANERVRQEEAKGYTVSIGNGDTSDTLVPIGDVESAKAAVEAVEEKLRIAQKAYYDQVRTNQQAVDGAKAEAEATRKAIEQLEQLKKLKEEMAEADRERRRIEESVAIRGAEAGGNSGEAAKIRERQEREEMAQQLRKQNAELVSRGLPQMDVEKLMSQFDIDTQKGKERALGRARDEMSIREMESRGDFTGASEMRRGLEKQDYADTLRRQGFDEQSVQDLSDRQSAVKDADQEKAMRRFNLEQRALELRGAGKEEDARALDFALKREDMSERIQRDLGLDPNAANALAEKRLGAEMALEGRSVSASALQRIGGGGGSDGGAKDQTTILREIRERLDKMLVQGAKDETSLGSQIGQF